MVEADGEQSTSGIAEEWIAIAASGHDRSGDPIAVRLLLDLGPG